MLPRVSMRAARKAWLAVGGALALLACGADEGSSRGAGARGGGGAEAGEGGTAGGAGLSGGTAALPSIEDPGECRTGLVCDGGKGLCAGKECCPFERACGDACCDGEDVCAFGKCLTPGAECRGAEDCRLGEYCELAFVGAAPDELVVPELGCDGMAKPRVGRCLPRPTTCGMDGATKDCLAECEWRPDADDFKPVQTYAWGEQITAPYDSDSMSTPIVIQLDDDDCDGIITARDIPEIVVHTYSPANDEVDPGDLHAISIVGGKVVEKWSVPAGQGRATPAGGNIDGKPGNEVVICDTAHVLTAFSGDGKMLWHSPATAACQHPALADLDGDGTVEVVVEGGILDGATGALEAAFTPAMIGTFAVSDIDGDMQLDIVAPTQAFHADGMRFIDLGRPPHSLYLSGPAVADLDLDGKPEVIGVEYKSHTLVVWRYAAGQPGNFQIVRAGLNINGSLDPSRCTGQLGATQGGGPITAGDFNDDGVPDIAFAGGVGYAVLDGDKLVDPSIPDAGTFLWAKDTIDCSSAATGSSLFDFNGDGKAEVVYRDEQYLHIYEGTTGKDLFRTCSTSATDTEEPVIADVDNDGQADVIVSATAYWHAERENNGYFQPCEGTVQSGVRVFSSAGGDWVRTRNIWNQHSYHVTNVEDDGAIPKQEKPNWLEPDLNNFRMNLQPGGVFAAPDAIVSLLTVGCGAAYTLTATVTNVGASVLPAGVMVEFVVGDPPGGDVVGTGATIKALFPLQSENVVFVLNDPPPAFIDGSVPVYARITTATDVHECRPDNNASDAVSGRCLLE